MNPGTIRSFKDMKNFFILLFFVPGILLSQITQTYRDTIVIYDAEHTCSHIINGEVGLYLEDNIKVIKEKKNDRWVISEKDRHQTKRLIAKALKQGNPEFVYQARNGLTFVISITDKKREDVSLNFIKFDINPKTMRIHSIEIQLGSEFTRYDLND